MKTRRLTALILLFAVCMLLCACVPAGKRNDPAQTDSGLTLITDADTAAGTDTVPESDTETEPQTAPDTETEITVKKGGTYDSKEDVALYIHLYGELPANYITKKEAQGLGWGGGSLKKYAPGKCIGGSEFGNYEGLLPKASGRIYYECDIDTLGASSRGAKRIIYSNDGLIYYTDDHYETFTLLYGEEGS